MKILILNWRDPKHPLAGGAEIALLEHAKYWQKKGAKVAWFGSSFGGAKEKEEIDGITYIRKGSHFTVHVWAFVYFLQKKLGNFDSVIDCFHFLPFFTPLYMKKSKIIALIHEVAKEVWFENLPWGLAVIGYFLEPTVFKLYRNIPFITVSESTKNELVKLGIQSKEITVIENGIRIPKHKKIPKSKNPVMLFLGRISQDKGIKDAVDAYERVYEEFEDVEFWIVGKEQEKGYLEKLVKKKKGKIRYFGFVSEERKYELLQEAWVLVHPSTREGWGLSVIEANSMGTPVVGYDVVGLRDSIQDNKTGLLVRQTPADLAQGVEALLQDKKFYNILSNNAKEWVKKFSWGKSTEKSWTLLKSLL